MKLKKILSTNKITNIKRITAPETRLDPASGNKIMLLSFIDANSNQRHLPTTAAIFRYAAGVNEDNEKPQGLDRLSDHLYTAHVNKAGKVICLDVVPTKILRSGAIAVSQEGVETLVFESQVNGNVRRLVQRPSGTRGAVSFAVLEALDKLAAKGKDITSGMDLGGVGRVVSAADDRIEVRLKRKGAAAVVSGGNEHEGAVEASDASLTASGS